MKSKSSQKKHVDNNNKFHEEQILPKKHVVNNNKIKSGDFFYIYDVICMYDKLSISHLPGADASAGLLSLSLMLGCCQLFVPLPLRDSSLCQHFSFRTFSVSWLFFSLFRSLGVCIYLVLSLSLKTYVFILASVFLFTYSCNLFSQNNNTQFPFLFSGTNSVNVFTLSIIQKTKT